MELLAERRYLTEGGDVLYPWPVRDLWGTEKPLTLRDGLEFLLEASPKALEEGTEVAVFFGLFSASLTSSEAKVEDWMLSGGTPPKHNPLRLWTMFSSQYADFGAVHGFFNHLKMAF